MTTEQLVRRALHAKAAEVRPEQVDMPYPVTGRAGRPLRVGLAIAVAAAVAAVLIATWVIGSSTGARNVQAAAGGSGSGNTSGATPANGVIVSAPFDLPPGWTGVTVSASDRYTSWCVTSGGTGTGTCDGLMVYQAVAGQVVPVDDTLVPACGARSTAEKLVAALTIDGRSASLVSQQCTAADPTWLVWRTADGTFAMVAKEGSAAADAALKVLPGVHLPGPVPAAVSRLVSTDQPVPSTSTCQPPPHRSTAMPTQAIGAGSTAAPIPSTEPAAPDDGCPTG